MKISKMRKRQQKFKDNFISINNKFIDYDKVIDENQNSLNQKDIEMKKLFKESNDYVYDYIETNKQQVQNF